VVGELNPGPTKIESPWLPDESELPKPANNQSVYFISFPFFLCSFALLEVKTPN